MFKNLYGKKGSVLFMVLSVMTVLLIIAQGLYLAVVTTRKDHYNDYYGKQAYQTSLSVNDTITAVIKNASPTDAFKSKVLGLSEGATMSTTENDFQNIPGMGKFNAKITRLANQTDGTDDFQVYKIESTTDYNGIDDTVVSIITYNVSVKDNDFDGFKRFFTSTGYTPNDTYYAGGIINSELYFDNENTIIREMGGGKDVRFLSSIIAAGTLLLDYGANMTSPGYDMPSEPTEWIIGNNLYQIANKQNSIAVINLNHGTIYVGGNYRNDKHREIKDTDMYVIGNFTLYSGKTSGTLYINGNYERSTENNAAHEFEKDIYVNGTVNTHSGWFISQNNAKLHISKGNLSKSSINGKTGNAIYELGFVVVHDGDAWQVDGSIADGSYKTVEEAKAYINKKIGKEIYPIWKIKDSDVVSSGYDAMKNEKQEIRFYYNSPTDRKYTHTINYSTTIGQIINDQNQVYSPTIIIDTSTITDSMGNTKKLTVEEQKKRKLLINLENNVDMDGDGEYDAFKWITGGTNKTGLRMNILIRGEGAVVFQVKDGTNYIASNQDFLGHESFYLLLGGEKYTQHGVTAYKNQPIDYDGKETAKLIYNKIPETLPSKSSADGVYYKTDKSGNEYWDGLNRINRNYINSNSSLVNKIKNDDGTINYPHTNIYITALGINSTLNFAEMDNIFTGYIYAPYMSFNAHSPGGALRMIGGIIVSDFVINSSNYYYYLKSDIGMEDLVSEDTHVADPTYTRNWRVWGY